MATVTTKAVFVNPPKGTSKWCSIKGADGLYYNYEQGKFDPAKGQSYTIEFDEKTRNDGSKWRPIKSLKSAEQTGNSSSGSVGFTGGNQNTGMEIFVTGMIGRCFHGTGQLPGQPELTSMIRACKNAWINGMKNPPVQSDEPPIPSEEDYGQ